MVMKNNIFTYAHRTAIVTGGSKNIGLSITEKFLAAGMQVAIISSEKSNIDSAKEYLNQSNSNVSFWQSNITHTASLEKLIANINQHHGSIDILVNNAALLEITSVEQTTEEDWDSVLDVNLRGTFFMTQKCLPYLKKGTAPRVINISSNAGRMGGYANGLAYTASKGGIISLTYGLARKLAPYGITVNCVAPGTIDSEMNRMRDIETQKELIKKFPLGRIGTPEEVASAVCYFASQESSFTTGAVLDVNGGMFMG